MEVSWDGRATRKEGTHVLREELAKSARRECESERTIPNSPAMSAPEVSPRVQIETLRSRPSRLLRFESRISSTISSVCRTFACARETSGKREGRGKSEKDELRDCRPR